MHIKKLIKAIRSPRIIILKLFNNKVFRLMPDSLYLKIKYQLILGSKLNLKDPKTFNEKLQWLKINDRDPNYTNLVDKYLVRNYIKETIGKEYLIPLVGVYDSFEEIKFEDLPNKFVLKPNHTSGDVFICKDKSKIDYQDLKVKINSWLKKEYYWLHREWPYKNVEPKIICEQYLEDKTETGLKDYKLMCFNGKVLCSFVALNRDSSEGLNVDFYDREWNLMPFDRHYPRSGIKLDPPKNYNEMIELSEALSKDMPFVRVDFYEIEGKLLFGEITFYPGSGFEEFTPAKYDGLLGDWIKLSKAEAL